MSNRLANVKRSRQAELNENLFTAPAQSFAVLTRVTAGSQDWIGTTLMTTPSGRRRYSRAEVEWPVTLLTSQNKTEGKAENVSPAGAFISCQQMPISQSSLRIVIKVPGHQPIKVAGKVVWSKAVNPEGVAPSFGVGVRFTQIAENDSHFLREVILKRYGKVLHRSVESGRKKVK